LLFQTRNRRAPLLHFVLFFDKSAALLSNTAAL
jgi:hypothetical protein